MAVAALHKPAMARHLFNMSNEITVQPAPGTLPALMQAAMQNGADPSYLRELLAVRREWQADEAKAAFNKAVSEFQRRAPIVEKLDVAYDKPYAKLDRIWRTIRPLLTELGLSVTWQICEVRDALIHVEGQLRHMDGHGEKLTMDLTIPEAIKGMNKAQQLGSAHSYAKRYAMCGALGVVTGEDSDDDGNGAGTVYVTDEQAEEIDQLVQACRGLNDFKEPVFWALFEAKVPQEIKADRFEQAKNALKKKLKESSK